MPLQAAWLGLAGIDRSGDYDILFPHLQCIAKIVHLTNDAELVLSGLPEGVGIALIAGTGSIALGRDRHGTITRAGGWGHIVGDEGSGYDLGRHCLQAISKAADGRGQWTALVEHVLSHWDLNSASDIIGRVYPDCDKATIASLSTLVFMAARDGDEVACSMVKDAAHELALAAMAVKNKLDFPGGQVALALGGGVAAPRNRFSRADAARYREAPVNWRSCACRGTGAEWGTSRKPLHLVRDGDRMPTRDIPTPEIAPHLRLLPLRKGGASGSGRPRLPDTPKRAWPSPARLVGVRFGSSRLPVQRKEVEIHGQLHRGHDAGGADWAGVDGWFLG